MGSGVSNQSRRSDGWGDSLIPVIPIFKVPSLKLRENKGNFSLVKGTAYRFIELVGYVPSEEDQQERALPIVVINENPEYKIGDHLYHSVAGEHETVLVYAVGEDHPLASFSAYPAYIEREVNVST